MISIEKIIIFSVSGSKGEIFEKILDVVRQFGISDVTELNVSNEKIIQIGELVIDSLSYRSFYLKDACNNEKLEACNNE